MARDFDAEISYCNKQIEELELKITGYNKMKGNLGAAVDELNSANGQIFGAQASLRVSYSSIGNEKLSNNLNELDSQKTNISNIINELNAVSGAIPKKIREAEDEKNSFVEQKASIIKDKEAYYKKLREEEKAQSAELEPIKSTGTFKDSKMEEKI